MPSFGVTIASTSVGTTTEDTDIASPISTNIASPISTNIKTDSAFVWPRDTDLIYLPGMMKVLLTLQLPLICTVLQDAFENLRASLLFEHTFPDPNTTVLFVRKNLVSAARSHLPRAVDVHKCLLCDNAYLEKLCHLVSVSPSNMICLTTSLAPCAYASFPSGS